MATDKPFSALDIIWGETSSEATPPTPPTTQEDKEFSALDEIWGVDTAEPVEQPEQQETPTFYGMPGIAQSDAATPFTRGLAQGATFGFSDEIAAGLTAPLTDRTYSEELAANRAVHEAARQVNPGSYLTGELGGAALSTAVPVLGLAGAPGRAGKVGTALQEGLQAPLLSWRGVGTGTGLGGLYGAGMSEADSIGEFVGDVGIGAGLGLGGAATFGTLGKGLSALGGYVHGTPIHRQAVKTLRRHGVPLTIGQQYPGLAPLEEFIGFSPASGVQKGKNTFPRKILNRFKKLDKKEQDVLSAAGKVILDEGDTFVNTALEKVGSKTGLPLGLLRGAGILGAGSQIGLLPTAGAISLPWVHRGVSSLQIPRLTGAVREMIGDNPLYQNLSQTPILPYLLNREFNQ